MGTYTIKINERTKEGKKPFGEAPKKGLIQKPHANISEVEDEELAKLFDPKSVKRAKKIHAKTI